MLIDELVVEDLELLFLVELLPSVDRAVVVRLPDRAVEVEPRSDEESEVVAELSSEEEVEDCWLVVIESVGFGVPASVLPSVSVCRLTRASIAIALPSDHASRH